MRLTQLLLLLLAAVAATPAHAQMAGSAVAYPDHLVGRKTASGEVYNPHGLTAAHPSLPFGTMLELLSPRTGRSVMVKVNDRGALLAQGELIVSEAAMRSLGLDPEEPAPVEARRFVSGSASRTSKQTPVAGPSPPPVRAEKPAEALEKAVPAVQDQIRYGVQLGSFSDRAAADRLAAQVEDAWIESARMGPRTIHRVMFGRFRERGEAEGWRARLNRLGIEGYVRTL